MKQSLSTWLVLALMVGSHLGDAYKILVVFPMPGKSHTILGDGVVRHLAAAGHQITYITPIIKKNPPSNVRQIDVSKNFELLQNQEQRVNIQTLMNNEVALDMTLILNVMNQIHNDTLNNENVIALLKDPKQNFDLVIAEWMFCEVYASLGAIFNTPFVWVSTVEPHWMVLKLIDTVPNPAYTPDTLSLSVPPFSFYDRFEQLARQLVGMALKTYYSSSFESSVYNSLAPYFKARGLIMPQFEELRYNASLMLGNSHVSLGQPVSLPPSYKDIGGYHIDTNVAPLPQDLQKIMDNAKHGVVYFSMGSNLNSTDMPAELKSSLLKIFGSLKQTVIWKFEEMLPKRPKNVHIVDWAPQPSILSHRNCLVFITHGGLLSTTESIHFAKPIIGIPVFADQFVNVNRAVHKGFAIKVDLSYTMADKLKAAIDEIASNPKYTNKVKELSAIYHDRPVTPGAELVHWAEHVIKTRGALHLRSPALQLQFYQKMYLDLAVVVLAVMYLIRAVFRSIFARRPAKLKSN